MLTQEEKQRRQKEIRLSSITNTNAIQHFTPTEKMLKALILKNEGLTFTEIGARMGITREGARQLCVACTMKIHWLTQLINE